MNLYSAIELILFSGCLAIALYIAYRHFTPTTQLVEARKSLWEEEKGGSNRSPISSFLATLNLDIKPAMLITLLSTTSVCVFLSFLEIFPERPWIASAAAIACLLMTLFVLNDLGLWLRRRFEINLVDAMDLIHAASAGGLAPRHALLVAARASTKSVQSEFTDLVMRLDYGLSVEKAVEPLLYRYNTEGVRLFAQALIAKWHSGSDFGLMLKSVGDLMRDQIKLRQRIIEQLSGARYAAVFTGLLPYLLVPLFLWKQPDWFAPLHNNPNGPSYLLGAIFLQLFAYLWLRRLLRTEI